MKSRVFHPISPACNEPGTASTHPFLLLRSEMSARTSRVDEIQEAIGAAEAAAEPGAAAAAPAAAAAVKSKDNSVDPPFLQRCSWSIQKKKAIHGLYWDNDDRLESRGDDLDISHCTSAGGFTSEAPIHAGATGG